MAISNLMSRLRWTTPNTATNKVLSIKSNLVNSITVIFGILIFGIYLAVDLSLDSWVRGQFDKALVNKSKYLNF